MDEFDASKDYKTIHLEWIKANRSFRPKCGLNPNYINYYDQMTAYYRETLKQQYTAYRWLRDDYMWSKKSKTINQEVAQMFGDEPINENPTFFITFNWSEDNFKIPSILTAIKKLFSKSWVDNARGVFEYHGLTNNHPHFMALVQVNKHKTFGRFKDKIFQSSLAQTLGKNFIDIKEAKTYHQDYLDLDKSNEKTECLEKDKVWRKSLGLLEEYNKKNI